MDHSISVIIPAYRAEGFIERSVRSVLGQSLAAGEIIVASDDGTDYVALLRTRGLEDPRVRGVFTDGIGMGPAHARNRGLSAASGRLIATLDADDILAPTALEVLAPLAVEHGAAYGGVRFIDNATGAELYSLDRSLNTGRVELEEILTSQVHTYAGIVFDRGRVTGRWPEWMERWEDVYFYVRCFDDLDYLYHVGAPLYHYHRVEGSICNRGETGQEYLSWADHLVDRLDRGDTLELSNERSREVFRRFLLSRRAHEEAFIRAVADDPELDYHAFSSHRSDFLYALDPVGTRGG